MIDREARPMFFSFSFFTIYTLPKARDDVDFLILFFFSTCSNKNAFSHEGETLKLAAFRISSFFPSLLFSSPLFPFHHFNSYNNNERTHHTNASAKEEGTRRKRRKRRRGERGEESCIQPCRARTRGHISCQSRTQYYELYVLLYV